MEKEAVEQWNRRVNDKEDAKWIISTVDVDAVELQDNTVKRKGSPVKDAIKSTNYQS